MNWPHILQDLKAAGYSYRGIQAAIGVHKDRVHAIAKGAEPYWSEGTKLLELHEKVEPVEHMRQGSVVENAREVNDGRTDAGIPA